MPKHHTAEFLPINAEESISWREIADHHPRSVIKSRIEQCEKGLRIQVETFVAAMPSKRIEINKFWPRDWWQAFRERWFPKWLRLSPIKYNGIYISQQLYSCVCPHLQKDPKSIHLDFLASEESPGGIIDGECND